MRSLFSAPDPFRDFRGPKCSCGGNRFREGFEQRRFGKVAAVWVCQKCGRWEVYENADTYASGPGPYSPPVDLAETVIDIEGGEALFAVEKRAIRFRPVTHICFHRAHLSIAVPLREFHADAIYFAEKGFCVIDVDLGYSQALRFGFNDYPALQEITALLQTPRLGISHFEYMEW